VRWTGEAAGLAVLAATCGCIATGQYKFLVPSAPGAIQEIDYNDYHVVTVFRSPDTVRLQPVNGSELHVRACNREEVVGITVGPFLPVIPWPPSVVHAFTVEPHPPLVVVVAIGMSSLTFDLSQVAVITPEDQRITAAAFGTTDHAACVRVPETPLPAEPLRISGPTMVELRFDMPAIPSTLSLEIGGMDCGAGRVDVPTIELRHGHEWILYPFNS